MTSLIKVDTIQDADGNNIINENSNTITIGASGDTTNIVGTLQNNGSAVGGTNTPAFSAYLSSNQSISTASFTKIQFDTETYDTDGTYDNSTNYRFTPGVAGKYLIFANMYLNSLSDGKNVRLDLYKNGSSIAFGRTDSAKAGSSVSVNFSYADSANTTDYYELFVYHNEGGSLNVASGARTSFGANKIIE